MNDEYSFAELWRVAESGLLVRDGYNVNLQTGSSQTYLDLKSRALELNRLYADSDIFLNPLSDLFKLISAAIELSDSWLSGSSKTTEEIAKLLYKSNYLDRIIPVALSLRGDPRCAYYLEKLSSGSLDPLTRVESPARNALWELELWGSLKSRSLSARLAEPDVVVEMKSGPIGFACKKIYSERGVHKVVQIGVRQIEAEGMVGIIAMNIDEIFPAHSVMKAPSVSALSRRVSDLNLEFMGRHEQTLEKYIRPGRVAGVMASTSLFGLIDGRIQQTRQFTFWAPPSSDENVRKHLDEFQRTLIR